MAKLRLSDVAKAAGVSTASVSNALNHKSGVNREKAERIRRLAAQMGYFGYGDAERKRIRFVIYKKHGKVVMDTAFFAQLFEGVQNECQRVGCDLLMNNVRAGDDLTKLMDMPMLLLATEMDEKDLKHFESLSHPIVLLDSDFRFEPFSSVSIDNLEAGYIAAKHLCSRGHKRIGFIDSSLGFNNMEDRYKGFVKGLSSEGLTPHSRVKLEPTIEGAFRDMSKYLETKPELPTAFFAGNDIMAIGAMRALKQADYRLPEDISIVGMDDMPMCLVVEPALSTVRVDKQGLGRVAVDRLLSIMDGDALVRRIRVGVSVVERDSVLEIS